MQREDYIYSWDRTTGSTEMFLEVHFSDGSTVVFRDIAVDSTRYTAKDSLLEFETDDRSPKTKLYYVPNVQYWETFYA